MIITDGKSQDPVEEHAEKLRNIGVEIFVLGMFYYSVFRKILEGCLFLETVGLFHWFFIMRSTFTLRKSEILLFFISLAVPQSS